MRQRNALLFLRAYCALCSGWCSTRTCKPCSRVMQWYDECSVGPGEDPGNEKYSPLRCRQSSDYSVGYDDHPNGNPVVGIKDIGISDSVDPSVRKDDDGRALQLRDGGLDTVGEDDDSLAEEHMSLLEEDVLATTRQPQKRPQIAAAQKAFRDTIVACNSLAMSALGRGNTERCSDLLARAFEVASAHKLAEPRSRGGRGESAGRDVNCGVNGDSDGDSEGIKSALQILTLNNTACLHRRLGEPRHALRCLRQAAQLGRRSSGSEHLEVTHLNACAVLSELDRHEEALEHARLAVYYGQEFEDAETQAGGAEVLGGDGQRGDVGRSRRARLATLAISYYNLAVELEYTHRYDACLQWYNEAVKLARDPDVHNEELMRTFQRSFAGARKKHAPQFPRRLGTVTRAPATVESVPIRKSARERKDPSNGHFPSRSGVRDTLRNGLPPNYNLGGDAAASPVRNASGCGRNADHELMYSEQVRHRHRRTKRPVFDGVEAQRASDHRRSKGRSGARTGATQNADCRADDVAALSHNVPKQQRELHSASFPGEKYRRDHVFRHREYSKNIREEAAWDSQNRASGKTSRRRPASGSAAVTAGGGGGGGGDGGENLRQTVSRKRPASADIVRERDRGSARRMHCDHVSEVSDIDEGAGEASGGELVRDRQKQERQRRRFRRRLPVEISVEEATSQLDNLRPLPGIGTAAAEAERQQRQPPESCRRPKSAYPRLQDGRGPPGDLKTQQGGCANGGTSSSRVRRIRSLSARALNCAVLSAVVPLRDIQRNAGRDNRDHHRRRAEEEEEEVQGREEDEEEAVKGTIPTIGRASRQSAELQGSTGVSQAATTINTLSTSRLKTKRVEGKPCMETSRSQTNRLAYSASAAEINPRRRKKSSTTAQVEAPQERSPDPQADPPSTAQQAASGATARVRKVAHSRRIPTRSSPSRSKKNARDREEGGRDGKTNPGNRSSLAGDNGRDGKLYLLDLHTGERERGKPSPPLTSFVLSIDCSESPCLDNGREGKLYVELDNGRDGKLYLEPERDESRSHERSLAAPSSLEPVVAATCHGREKTERGRQDTSETVEGSVAGRVDVIRRKAGESLYSGVESPAGKHSLAADIIQTAMSNAVVRRRSTGRGQGKEGREFRETLPELFSLDQEMGDCEALTERGYDRSQRKYEQLQLGATDGAVAVSEVDLSKVVDKERQKRQSEAIDHRVLAASTVRAWAVRASLIRRLHRSRRSRVDLERRWEAEVHRIAATRIQALARGAARRRENWKAEEAVVHVAEGGWRGCLVMKEPAHTRCERRRVSCEKIQRLFRGHQGRLEAARSRQIAWEETVARQGAAGMLQSAWRQSRNRPLVKWRQQQQQQLQQQQDGEISEKESAPVTAESEKVASTAPTDDTGQDRQVWQGSQTDDVIYSLWSAVTSLVTAAATRHAVRKAVGQSLLGPAAETLAAFNRECVGGTINTSLGSSVTPSASVSSGSSKAPMAEGSPDPASFECALRFKRKMTSATRKMAGAVRTRLSSISVIKAAAERLLAGSSDDGDGYGDGGRDGHNGGGNGESEEPDGTATEMAEAEVMSIVFNVAQECWTFLSSLERSGLLAGLDDRTVGEKITEILSGALQGLIGNLGRTRRLTSASHPACEDGKRQERKANTTSGGDDRRGHLTGGLSRDWKQPRALPVQLVRALTSSGTTILLSHPDVSELVTARTGDGGNFGRGRGSVAAFQHEGGEVGCGGDETSSDDYDEYVWLVAEAWWSLTLATGSDRGDDGGGSGDGDCGGGNGIKVVARSEDEQAIKTTEDGNKNELKLEVEQQPQHQEQRPAVLVQERVDERLQFLLSVSELIDCAAEEIVYGMGVPNPLSPECYDDPTRRMTNSLWILAQCKSCE